MLELAKSGEDFDLISLVLDIAMSKLWVYNKGHKCSFEVDLFFLAAEDGFTIFRTCRMR